MRSRARCRRSEWSRPLMKARASALRCRVWVSVEVRSLVMFAFLALRGRRKRIAKHGFLGVLLRIEPSPEDLEGVKDVMLASFGRKRSIGLVFVIPEVVENGLQSHGEIEGGDIPAGGGRGDGIFLFTHLGCHLVGR